MEAVDEYKPANEFQEDVKDPLLEVPLSDSTELWLIQWPAGKISRRVSLVRYPELSEFEKKAKSERWAQKNARTLSTALTPCKSSGGKRATLPAFSGMSRGTPGDLSLGSTRRGKLCNGGEPSSKHPKEKMCQCRAVL